MLCHMVWFGENPLFRGETGAVAANPCFGKETAMLGSGAEVFKNFLGDRVSDKLKGLLGFLSALRFL